MLSLPLHCDFCLPESQVKIVSIRCCRCSWKDLWTCYSNLSTWWFKTFFHENASHTVAPDLFLHPQDELKYPFMPSFISIIYPLLWANYCNLISTIHPLFQPTISTVCPLLLANLNCLEDFHLNKCLLSHYLSPNDESHWWLSLWPTDESLQHLPYYDLGVGSDFPRKITSSARLGF